MSGDCMVYPLLISLANIVLEIWSKISLHTYIVGVITSAVPHQLLVAVSALQDFHYLAQTLTLS